MVEHFVECHGAQTARVTCVAVVGFSLRLVTGYLDFLCIDHDDVVAGINVRGKFGLMLTTQAASNLGCQTTERFVRSVDNVPVALDGLRLSTERLHG